MGNRSALPIAASVLILATTCAAAETLVSGSVGVSAPCQAWQGNRLQATVVIVKEWPNAALFDQVLRCEHDDVDFTVPWNLDRASAWLREARDRGFVDRPVDSTKCGKELDLACGEHGSTASRRFDPDGHGFDRCTGVCTDGTAVRTIRTELDRTPSR